MKNLFKIQKYSLNDGIFDFNIDHSVTKVIKKFYEDTPFLNYKDTDNKYSILEIGNKNIRANCVAPGATETRMLADVPMEILNDIKSGIPKGEIAKVSEIVPSYVFLASEAANHFVGQCLSPNGGDVFL